MQSFQTRVAAAAIVVTTHNTKLSYKKTFIAKLFIRKKIRRCLSTPHQLAHSIMYTHNEIYTYQYWILRNRDVTQFVDSAGIYKALGSIPSTVKKEKCSRRILNHKKLKPKSNIAK